MLWRIKRPGVVLWTLVLNAALSPLALKADGYGLLLRHAVFYRS